MDAETLRDVVLRCIACEYPAELWRSRLDRELEGRVAADEILRALNYLHGRGLIEWRTDCGVYVYRLSAAGWRATHGAVPHVAVLAGTIADVLSIEYPHHLPEQRLLGALLERRGISGVSAADYKVAIGYLLQCGYVEQRRDAVTAGAVRLDLPVDYRLTPDGVDLVDGKMIDEGVTLP